MKIRMKIASLAGLTLLGIAAFGQAPVKIVP
jgi:hypothetical protein